MKSAIYPGSFDPITNGHLDIVRRARDVFDEVTIAVLNNIEKRPLFDTQTRIQQIQDLFEGESGIKVEGFNGLLVDYAREKNVRTIIRGLRALSDFDYEFQIALTNRKLAPTIDTVFFMTDESHAYLSSSIVKQVAKFGGDVSDFVPESIQMALSSAYEKSR